MKCCLRVLLLGFFFTTSVNALPAATLVGNAAEDFSLRSSRGREYSLGDFSDEKLVVLAFLGTECPLVKLYGPRLSELHDKFADKGVAFIGINSNTQDSVTEITAYADRFKLKFPMLKDVGNRVADAMQATRTPEVFLLDENRMVRYHGRIDDQYVVGLSRDKAERQDLSIAIEELLAGKDVTVPETEVIGCHIGRVQTTEPTGDITYSNQISRIFNKRCLECHRDGEIAPFPLASYEDVIGWEDTIVEVIQDRRMPPWFADPKHGEFKNDARLTPKEKELIFAWVENGMPEGDRSQLPEPPKFTEGWRIPKPDQVFHMNEDGFQVPAEGVVDYKHFVVDPQWDEDKYIYAAEAKPDNVSVVHHILVYVLPPGERRADLREILVGYSPGSTPVLHEKGVALHVPAGSKLLFQMHYTPNGYAQKDRSYAGVCFIDKKDVTKLRKGRLAINTRFRIPPNTDDHPVTADYRSRIDEMLVAMTPHMHLRGKSFRYEATFPNGEKEVLLDVPKYDFNWQIKYVLKEPKLLPKGTRILCTATYDNTENNLANPNPNRAVHWGDQSFEEMMIGFFDTIDADKKSAPKRSSNVSIDPSGNWKWNRAVGLKKVEETLTLELEGDQLSGVLNTSGESVEIEDAFVTGDTLKFAVAPKKFRGMVLDFEAKVSDNELKGTATISMQGFGRSQTLPWVAKRVTE